MTRRLKIHLYTAYVIVTILAAGTNIYAAVNDFTRAEWLQASMTRLRVPDSWLFPLGALKAAGALGLLLGIRVPLIGTAAAIGLILFFVAATITHLHARDYSHLLYPSVWLLLAAGSLVLQLASL